MRISLRYAIAVLLALSAWQFARAQGVTSLTFVRPPAQGPGTSGFQTVSDPTVRPFQPNGSSASVSRALPIDFQGNGRPDLLACYGSSVPYQVRVPCRVLRPQPDGSVTDV